MFDTLLHLKWPELVFHKEWMRNAIGCERFDMVTVLANQFPGQRQSEFVKLARSTDMLDHLMLLGFKFGASLVVGAIRSGETEKVKWFLNENIREQVAGSYLEAAIQCQNIEIIELLAQKETNGQKEFKCLPHLMMKAFETPNPLMIAKLYSLFYFDRMSAFDNYIQHNQFLEQFMNQLRTARDRSPFFLVLRWMDGHHWQYDLNSSLLYTFAIGRESVEDFQLLVDSCLPGLNANHMDQAIQLSDSTIMDALLRLPVPILPSQLGMEQLRKQRNIPRLQQLLHHPELSRTVRCQPLLDGLPQASMDLCYNRPEKDWYMAQTLQRPPSFVTPDNIEYDMDMDTS